MGTEVSTQSYNAYMSQVEISPGGVGFIRTPAQKVIPNAPKDGARRKSWLDSGSVSNVVSPVRRARTVRRPGA